MFEAVLVIEASDQSANVDRPAPETDGESGRSPRSNRSVLFTAIEALRPQQWLKNTLIFLPILAAQELTRPATVLAAGIAFLSFSLIASASYVLNDRLDVERDRAHPSKRLRPFASGRLPLAAAPLISISLLALGFGIAGAFLPRQFVAVLFLYLLLTVAYSVKLKGAVLIDVFVLATLYTLRIVAGAAATNIPLSVWLVGFSLFLFLSLAMVKRYAELHLLARDTDTGSMLPTGRSYRAGDLPVLISLGCVSGYISALVLALYIISDEVSRHYADTVWTWGLVPLLLYWISRAWLVVARSEMTDDPLVWALKDQLSRWVLLAAFAILVIAA